MQIIKYLVLRGYEYMDYKIQSRCEKFIENRDIIKKCFKWESSYMYPLCAQIYTSKGKTADCDELKHCVALLKKNAGILSYFRSTARLPYAAMLAVSGAPETTLDNSLTIYELLKKRHLLSTYLPAAAIIAAQLSRTCEYEQVAVRAKEIYNEMKATHPLITSGEDGAFAVILALSPRGDEQLLDEIERCYTILKPSFLMRNSVQSLSHVLALCDGSADEKCRRVLDLYRLLKERGCSYGTNYELPTLGVIAASAVDLNAAASDIVEIDGFLSTQKGFSAFGAGKKQRLMYAVMLAQGGNENNAVLQTAALNSTISMIVAQQAAVFAAIAAANASSVAAAGASTT